MACQRFVGPLQLGQNLAEIAQRLGIVRRQGERSAVSGLGRGEMALAGQRDTMMDVRIDEVGHQLQRTGRPFQGRLVQPLPIEHGGQIGVGLGELGLQCDGGTVARRRLVETTERLQRVAEVLVSVGEIRRAGESARDQLNGIVVAAALVGDDAQQVERVDLVRRAAQHLPVKAFGALAPSRLVMLNAHLQVSGNLCLPTDAVLFIGYCHRPGPWMMQLAANYPRWGGSATSHGRAASEGHFFGGHEVNIAPHNESCDTGYPGNGSGRTKLPFLRTQPASEKLTAIGSA